MGLDNRDYVHDESGYDGFGGGGGRPPGAAGLSAIAKVTIVVGVAYVLAMLIPDLAANLTLSWAGLKSGKLWQLLTYAITPLGVAADHPDRGAVVAAANRGIISFAFALYILFQFGRQLTQFVGAKETVGLLGAAVLAGGVVAAVVSPQLGAGYANVWTLANVTLVGVAMRRPHDKILLFFVLPVPLWAVAAAIVGFSVLTAVSGNAAAVAPMLASLAVAAAHEKKGVRFAGAADAVSDWRRRRSQPKLKVHRPEADEDEGFDDRVDAVLAKLGEQGEASLTGKERRLLKQASKRYKDRV